MLPWQQSTVQQCRVKHVDHSAVKHSARNTLCCCPAATSAWRAECGGAPPALPSPSPAPTPSDCVTCNVNKLVKIMQSTCVTDQASFPVINPGTGPCEIVGAGVVASSLRYSSQQQDLFGGNPTGPILCSLVRAIPAANVMLIIDGQSQSSCRFPSFWDFVVPVITGTKRAGGHRRSKVRQRVSMAPRIG